MKKSYNVNLLIGDVANVSHHRYLSLTINSNIPASEIENAYENGTELLGFDISEELMDDCIMSDEAFSTLKSFGFNGKNDFNFVLYAELYLFVCQLGNNEFSSTFVDLDEIDIGGIGVVNDS